MFRTWLGEAYHADGRLDAACDLAQRGLDMARDIKYPHGIGLAQRALGRIAHRLGNVSEAGIHLQSALETFASIQERIDLASLAHAWFKKLQIST